MTPETKNMLRVIVGELTCNGANMGGLLYTWEEVACWLRKRKRDMEAQAIEAGTKFRLTGTDAGLVWLLTGGGFVEREELVDYGRSP